MVDQNTKVIIADKDYFFELDLLLSNTTKRTIANYVIWRYVMAWLPYLNKEAREVAGVENANIPRWKTCVQTVESFFKPAIGSMYAKKFLNKSTKTAVAEMVQYIKQAFEKVLEEVKGISD